MKICPTITATFLLVFFQSNCDSQGNPTGTGSQTLSEKIIGNWYVARTVLVGISDSAYSSLSTTVITRLEATLWNEYGKTDTATIHTSFGYSLSRDSIVTFVQGSQVVSGKIDVKGDTLYVSFPELGFEQKTWYLKWNGSVPPSNWPQRVVNSVL